jgi:hypothetical protein
LGLSGNGEKFQIAYQLLVVVAGETGQELSAAILLSEPSGTKPEVP